MLSRLSSHTIQTTQRLAQITKQFTASHSRTMAYAGTKQKLNTGAEIPAMGFGTWQDKDAQEDAVYEALKAGYRHIDTARVYGTEPAVAKGIKRSGVPRSEIFITTKLWNNSHHPDDVEKACDDSLKDLQTDYLDLFLMHWPAPFKRSDTLFPRKDDKIETGDADYVETYKAMEKLVESGKCKAIGVSNFSKSELERLLKEVSTVPAAHQFEKHPYLAQLGFEEFHKQKGIHITQYSPFGNQNEMYSSGKDLGKLIDDPTLVEIGKKYQKNGAQVALAWGIAKGHSVIPKSKTPARIRANLEGDFKLDPEDVQKIDSMDKKLRFNDPSKSFYWDFYSDLDGKQH